MNDKIKYLEWDESYVIGISKIDQQHQELLELINKLHRGILLESDTQTQKDILQEFYSFLVSHCQTEEELFEKHDYPDKIDHKKQHQELISNFENFIKAFDQDPKSLNESFFNYVKNWVLEHVIEEDMKFAEFYLQKITS